MTPLYTIEQFENAKSRDLLPLLCKNCQKPFYKAKNEIQKTFTAANGLKSDFCSRSCISKNKTNKITVICKNCFLPFQKSPSQIKKTKYHFCSHKCSAIYNNTHKTTGVRRSKLEMWLEQKLLNIYPTLEIHFNRKDAIGSEIDIYIPCLKLAFELNGIFHYEPIYGHDKFSKIINNDNRKFQACLEKGIELCIIDTSSQKYFKESTSQKYLDIIVKIINGHG